MKHLELVKDSFTLEHFDKQAIENKPYVAYSIKDKEVIYTIIPKEDGTMYTIYRVVSKDISNCTYNMVDLGLSVKWADRNVGATNPEHYGSYFQWGDTNAYTFDGVGEVTVDELAEMLNPQLSPELGMEITKDNVGMILEQIGVTGTDLTLAGIGLSLDKEFSWETYFDTTDGGSTFNKYNDNGGLTILESMDDAATAHMGSQYRMPTMDEIRELVENTTHTFIDIDGNEYDIQFGYDNTPIEEGKLKGVRVTGPNGNSIFLPAASWCNWSTFGRVGLGCELWSSSLYVGYGLSSRSLHFYHNGDKGVISSDRFIGHSVRGVQP